MATTSVATDDRLLLTVCSLTVAHMVILETAAAALVNGLWVVAKALYSSVALGILVLAAGMLVVLAAELEEAQKQATNKPRSQLF